MIKNQFEQDCKTLAELIQTGSALIKKAPSCSCYSIEEVPQSEQKCYSWFVETNNFLSQLLGETDSNVKMFRKAFSTYESSSFLGTYNGEIHFVKEDLHKGIGILEGIHASFMKGIIKRKEELIKVLEKTTDRIRVMFDNDVLNKIVEGKIDVERINKSNKFEIYATHIQTDQASNCKDTEKRAKLILSLAKLSPKMIATESAVYGVSRFDEAKMSGPDGKLDDLRQGNNKHTSDALIGETAIKNGILLVTNDKTLKSRVNSNGGRAISLEEFERLV